MATFGEVWSNRRREAEEEDAEEGKEGEGKKRKKQKKPKGKAEKYAEQRAEEIKELVKRNQWKEAAVLTERAIAHTVQRVDTLKRLWRGSIRRR